MNTNATEIMPQGTILYVEHENNAILSIVGAWTLENYQILREKIEKIQSHISKQTKIVIIDGSNITALDTNGSLCLKILAEALIAKHKTINWQNFASDNMPLLNTVMNSDLKIQNTHRLSYNLFHTLCTNFGDALVRAWQDTLTILGFLGAVLVIFGNVLRGKTQFRTTSMVFHIHQAGLNAVPIVMLISFLIGAIIAQQGAYQLARFGAQVFTINLVGVLVLREIGVLLTAIMFAGRSGSAFTAEIGAMKMREEIDALKVMGRSPIEVLVLPRLCALVISLPLLTIVSNFAALFGAMLTAWVYIGIHPTAFIVQLQEAIAMKTFLTGLAKAPFMALFIGIIACIEGMKVQGSADSLGRQTTSSVVKSIFIVLVLDGIFAMIFAALKW